MILDSMLAKDVGSGYDVWRVHGGPRGSGGLRRSILAWFVPIRTPRALAQRFRDHPTVQTGSSDGGRISASVAASPVFCLKNAKPSRPYGP